MLGYIRVRRVCVDLHRDSPSMKFNMWFTSQVQTFVPTKITTPLLIVYQGKGERIGKMVFGVYISAEQTGTVEKEVSYMAREFIEYLCRRLRISKEWLFEMCPLIKMACEGE